MISNIDVNQNIDLITDTKRHSRRNHAAHSFNMQYVSYRLLQCKQKNVSSDETICYQIFM